MFFEKLKHRIGKYFVNVCCLLLLIVCVNLFIS